MENVTAYSGLMHVGTVMAPPYDITSAVFHRVIARKYEDAADSTTKREERRACLNAALHHYLEAYAEDSPDAQ